MVGLISSRTDDGTKLRCAARRLSSSLRDEAGGRPVRIRWVSAPRPKTSSVVASDSGLPNSGARYGPAEESMCAASEVGVPDTSAVCGPDDPEPGLAETCQSQMRSRG